MKGQKVDKETDSARPFEGKGEFPLLQMKTPFYRYFWISDEDILQSFDVGSEESNPKQLANALAVLQIKASTFHSYHIAGKTERV